MKTLVYGMQSSGASYITWRLSQDPNTISVLDLCCHAAPTSLHDESENYDVIMKCVANTMHSFDEIVETFQPDVKILVTRNMDDIVKSLEQKSYRNDAGTIPQKIEVFENVVKKYGPYFDKVIAYEDIVKEPFEPTRSVEEIVEFNSTNSEWCRNNYRVMWGIGGIHA